MRADACSQPSDVTSLPEMVGKVPSQIPSSQLPADGDDDDIKSGASNSVSGNGPEDASGDDAELNEDQQSRQSKAKRPSESVDVRCGALPPGSSLEAFYRPPLQVHVRSAEGKYLQSFAESLFASQSELNVSTIRYTEHVTWNLDLQEVLESYSKQRDFFRSVDGFRLDPLEPWAGGRKKGDDYDEALARARRSMPMRPPSETVVMEAAFFLIQQGLLNIPDVGSINVKQARAFLWNAAWLQQHMTAEWQAKGELPIPPLERTLPRFEKYCLAIMGAGGTGKTGVLKISETLTVFFAGPETVRKLAPSNAAARLLGGDTLHALCKLPWGKARLTSKKGRLQKSTLELHRKNWRTAVAAYIDEISMVSSDQFLQCDVRFRQAKMQPSHRFGGLALNVCGDFLQLPPVDKDGTRKGLAVPLNDYGVCDVSEAESQCAENATEQKSDEDADVPTARQRKQANVEGRQGFELWRQIRRVVCLTVNVRAPGILSRLQSEMRDGKISDEMWAVYQSRVLVDDDSRLTAEHSPFTQSDPCFIVHRHRIRVMRSFENAKRESRRLGVPLYSVQARDEATDPAHVSRLTAEVTKNLLRRVNPEQTKGLSSFLPLYKGMRLLMSSKDCVRFGLVKGCTCILREIVFSEREELPYVVVAGDTHRLEYMPVSLLLQADEAVWILPASELPKGLPANIDRRGLFQLRPQHDYLRVHSEGETFSVRRTGFRVTPADTITVYAAQGGTYDAVVADMQRPPNIGPAQHWLACYVMLSRARSIDGFLVLRPATRAELSARPPQYLLDELDRLENLEAASLGELVSYIQSLPCDVPEGILELLRDDAVAKEAQRVQNVRTGVAAPNRRLRRKTSCVGKDASFARGSSKRLRANGSIDSTCVDGAGEAVSVRGEDSKSLPLHRADVLSNPAPDASCPSSRVLLVSGLPGETASSATATAYPPDSVPPKRQRVDSSEGPSNSAPDASTAAAVLACGVVAAAAAVVSASATAAPTVTRIELAADVSVDASNVAGPASSFAATGASPSDFAVLGQSTDLPVAAVVPTDIPVATAASACTRECETVPSSSQVLSNPALDVSFPSSRVLLVSGPPGEAASSTTATADPSASAPPKRQRVDSSEGPSNSTPDTNTVAAVFACGVVATAAAVFSASATPAPTVTRIELAADVSVDASNVAGPAASFADTGASPSGFAVSGQPTDLPVAAATPTDIPVAAAASASTAASPGTGHVPRAAATTDCFGAHLSTVSVLALRERLRLGRAEKPSSSDVPPGTVEPSAASLLSMSSTTAALLSGPPSSAPITSAISVSDTRAASLQPSVMTGPSSGSTLSGDLNAVFYRGIKPRALVNMITEEGGGGSCWINAALQALWAPVSIKEALRNVSERTFLRFRCELEGILSQRSRYGIFARSLGQSLETVQQRVGLNRKEESFLAATFRAACTAPLTSPLAPCTITNHFYHGRQEDASELLTRFLLDAGASPSLSPLFSWHMYVTMKCTSCGHARPHRIESFSDLALPLASERVGQEPHVTVQDALDDYLQGEPVAPDAGSLWDDPCPNVNCGRRDQMYLKSMTTMTSPRVLYLQLKRWQYITNSDGESECRCVSHPVRATDPLLFGGAIYRLQSIVVHDGCSISTGHYVAVARHDTTGGLCHVVCRSVPTTCIRSVCSHVCRLHNGHAIRMFSIACSHAYTQEQLLLLRACIHEFSSGISYPI